MTQKLATLGRILILAVGLATALKIARNRQQADHDHLSSLADYFIDRVMNDIPDIRMNGPRENRIPQVVNISFAGIEGESIVISLDLDGIAVSSGSACTSGAIEPSHVLTAMGVDPLVAQGAIRFSMGRTTTREQIDYLLGKLPPIVTRLRDMSPVYKQSRK